MLKKQRIAAESTEEREARLQRVRSGQEQRIAAESTEEREARLQHLRDAWHRRVTSETTEQTEARRHGDSSEYQAQLEAFEPSQLHNPHIHLKMKEFHSKLSTLKVSTCVTCLEGFPGLIVRSASASCAESECLRCAHDKHIPKFYSSANNMNPGFSIHFVQTTISLQ